MILKRYVLTEKVFNLGKNGENSIYCFYVDKDANKITVKKEVEKQFSVVVDSVNILNNSKKVKRVYMGRRMHTRVKGGEKKAYVTLKQGYSINFENSL